MFKKSLTRNLNSSLKIDWEESTNAGRVCVRPHIDEELDNRKHVYHGIDSVLVGHIIYECFRIDGFSLKSTVAEQICEKIPSGYEYASSLNVVYFPQLGMSCHTSRTVLIPFQDFSSVYQCWTSGVQKQVFNRSMDGVSRYESLSNGMIRITELLSFHPSALFFVSECWSPDRDVAHMSISSHKRCTVSGPGLLPKTSKTWIDMDIHIGDLHSLIVDREIEIIQALLEEILVYDQAMGYACDVCAELDCLLSFAEASRMYNYQRPRMVEGNIIDIQQGRCDTVMLTMYIVSLRHSRHPLQEQVVDTFVPNDVHIAGGNAGITTDTMRDGEESNSILLCTGANACGKVCSDDSTMIYA